MNLNQNIFLILLLVGFSFEVCYLEKNCCNDLESYYQCNTAQEIVNQYCNYIIQINNSVQLINEIPDLNCGSSIMCCGGSNYFCQNMNSVQKCENATFLLETFLSKAKPDMDISIPNFNCFTKKSVNSRGTTVYDYYENSSKFLQIPIFVMFIIVLFVY